MLLLASCGSRGAAPEAPAANGPGASAVRSAPVATAATSPQGGNAAALAESLDALYAKARQEGEVSLYATVNRTSGPKIFQAFEARFPGVQVNWTDGTAERLSARIMAESRGGKVLVDVLQTNIENVAQLRGQGLVADLESVPEAAAYPDALRGAYWVASDLKFYVVAWNTTLVKPEDEPRQFEDLAEPRWKDRIMIDSGDAQFLAAIAKHKYQSDDRAAELLRRIAANDPEFHTGHSELVELLVAGQRDVCLTCFSHHFPPRLARGAPLGYLLAEGVGLISANATFRNAPHPHAARLFTRWVTSEEGQQAYAIAGHTPAHPAVPPVEATRPEKIYPLTATDMQDYSRYERQWRDTFRLRAGQ